MMIRALHLTTALLALAGTRVALGTESLPPAAQSVATASTIEAAGSTITTRAADGRPAPSTDLEVSVLGDDGNSIRLPAKTDALGKLQIGYVPWNEFVSGSAPRGDTLRLPDSGFGSLRALGGAAATSAPATFAIQESRFVDPRRYALNLVSPFALFCRSDEGPPKTLSTGGRFAFEVPGDAAAVARVRALPLITGFEYYRLPGESGYGASVAAGADPDATWIGLQGLARSGAIRYLEKDPCWRFLPESGAAAGFGGCVPGVREYPEKAVHLSGTFGTTLLGPKTNTPIPGAWVLYGPLSPNPFWDPGPRSGDEGGPTVVRTSGDGAYSAPLDGMDGPIEIGVATGCDGHTTVAIADGQGSAAGPASASVLETRVGGPSTTAKAPGTQTAPPASSSGLKPPKPAPGARVCGPDVTNHVLDALEYAKDTFRSWGIAERVGKCLVLYNPLKYNAAWELKLFAPSDGGEGKKAGDDGWMPYIFFQRAAPDYCAIPREPCGATVEFMGYCIHAQVVNYLLWGEMNQLCQSQLKGRLANLARSAFSKDYPGQHAMSVLGEHFAESGSDIAAKKAEMKKMLDEMVKDKGAAWDQMDGTDCPLTCDGVASGANDWLNLQPWDFQWGDFHSNRKQERVTHELEQLRKAPIMPAAPKR